MPLVYEQIYARDLCNPRGASRCISFSQDSRHRSTRNAATDWITLPHFAFCKKSADWKGSTRRCADFDFASWNFKPEVYELHSHMIKISSCLHSRLFWLEINFTRDDFSLEYPPRITKGEAVSAITKVSITFTIQSTITIAPLARFICSSIIRSMHRGNTDRNLLFASRDIWLLRYIALIDRWMRR
jgi:hypothetical protein